MKNRFDSPGNQGNDILKNKEAVQQLLSSPDTQKVFQLLRQKDSGQLQQAAQAALKGDSSALTQLMQDLTKHPDAAQAVENLNKKFNG